MVKAELDYNPYLFETTIHFNGKKPKINSLVEQYENGFLEDWVKDLPDIFYGEMNGYNFELDFSGTDLDFEEIKKSLNQSGVSERQVYLFHKGDLADRDTKIAQIKELLSWLDKHKNHMFDNESFHTNNEKLIDTSFLLKIVQPRTVAEPVITLNNVTAENIYDINELTDSKLKYIPVVFLIDETNVKKLPLFISKMMTRKDVSSQQLFFILDPKLDKAETARVINDLGILHPQIIESVNDDEIDKYFEIYPISDYIYKSIQMFEHEEKTIDEKLDEESKASEISNSSIHEQISNYENKISKLKEVYDKFTGRTHLVIPYEFEESRERLIDRIRNWKSRKTNTTYEDEAEKYADDYNDMAFRALSVFIDDVDKICSSNRVIIKRTLREWAEPINDIIGNSIKAEDLKEHNRVVSPIITDDLLKLKTEEQVVRQEKSGLFFRNNKKGEMVNETTWSFPQWRKYVEETIQPIANNLLNECYDNLNDYYNDNSELYVQFLDNQIKELLVDKGKAMEQLSEDDKRIQEDKDWFAEYCEKLSIIKRG